MLREDTMLCFGTLIGAVALLDQHAVDAAQPQLAGEREPDRPGADDED